MEVGKLGGHVGQGCQAISVQVLVLERQTDTQHGASRQQRCSFNHSYHSALNLQFPLTNTTQLFFHFDFINMCIKSPKGISYISLSVIRPKNGKTKTCEYNCHKDGVLHPRIPSVLQCPLYLPRGKCPWYYSGGIALVLIEMLHNKTQNSKNSHITK